MSEEELAEFESRGKKPKAEKPPAPTEHAEQVAVFQWADAMTHKYSELALLFAIPNGGDRHPAVAAKLKAEGVKPGVCDLFLPVARGSLHGLFIEMKAEKGRVSPSQESWICALRSQEYGVVVSHGAQAAIDHLEWYLNLES